MPILCTNTYGHTAHIVFLWSGSVFLSLVGWHFSQGWTTKQPKWATVQGPKPLKPKLYFPHPWVREGSINFIIRGRTRWLYADVRVPPICCNHADLSGLVRTSTTLSGSVLQKVVKTELLLPWCPQLSTYASTWEYNRGFRGPEGYT